MRVRCDCDSRAQVYLLLILKTLGKLGKNVWRMRESWIRGYPDSRTIYIVRTIEALRYKTQDSGPCPYGTLLCVEDKLGDPDIVFPSL